MIKKTSLSEPDEAVWSWVSIKAQSSAKICLLKARKHGPSWVVRGHDASRQEQHSLIFKFENEFIS